MRLSRAQRAALVVLLEHRDEWVRSGFRRCRSNTLYSLEKLRLATCRHAYPGGDLEARITPAGARAIAPDGDDALAAETERLDLVERGLDLLASTFPIDTYRLPVPASRRAWWRRRVLDRARARGLDVFAIYRPAHGKPHLEVFVLREKGEA